MAHTVTVTQHQNGPRAAYIKVFLKCDGASGELNDSAVITPGELGMKSGERLTVEQIWYDLTGFTVRLEFNDLVDYPVWVCGSSSNHVDFRVFGGLSDRSGLDSAGGLQITTSGFDAATKQGALIIKVRKS